MADQPADHPTYTAADLGLDDPLVPCDVDPQLVMVDRVHSNRPLDPAKVGALLKAPEQDRQRHPVLVGVRKSGSSVCVEGQHRVTAAMLLGDPSVPALVFPSDGWRTERDVYLAFQSWAAANLPDKPMRLDAAEGDSAG